MLRIIIAEDHHVVRAAIAAFLEKESDIEVVGQVADASLLLSSVAQLRPDVLVLDAHMPGHRVTDTAQRLRQQFPQVRILVLSAYNERAYVTGLMRAGAAGYVLKDDPPETLVKALHAVAEGKQWFSARVIQTLAQGPLPEVLPQVVLTEREIEVLRYLAQGYRNDQIAKALCISEFTVKNHLHNIFGKLGIKTRAEAVRYALKHGLTEGDQLSPPE